MFMVVVIAGGKVHCLYCQGRKGSDRHDNRHVVENTLQGGRLYLSAEDINLFGINLVYLANAHKKNTTFIERWRCFPVKVPPVIQSKCISGKDVFFGVISTRLYS